jgi:hypothetical protein
MFQVHACLCLEAQQIKEGRYVYAFHFKHLELCPCVLWGTMVLTLASLLTLTHTFLMSNAVPSLSCCR